MEVLTVKKAVIDELREKRGLTRDAADQAIQDVFGAVSSVLERGDTVSIPGFGTFKRDFRDTREARNPRTGETVTVQGRHVIKFREPRQRAR
jgi:DNA-binding protein HU-beta